jgi:hypothetical protein
MHPGGQAAPVVAAGAIAGVAAFWWLADPVLLIVMAGHFTDTTLNRRAWI